MVRMRLPKRPPPPSDSEDEEWSSESSEPDDETSSEQESAEETSESEELTLPVGAAAEVRPDDPGFVGSFYDVTVTAHHHPTARGGGGHYTVVYSTLLAEDGGPLEETVAAADVRPRRPPPPRDGRRREFLVLEAVEAFHNEGWWAGVVSAVPPPPLAGAPRLYEVSFPTSRETLEFEETALRPHRVFRAGRWVPAAEVENGSPLFREGTQVEVSQCAKSFGESWSPACVLKVIGASNFLVQYTHIGQDRERATEIIDYQYIRPARTDTRPSRTSHVEVMHEGSWWPGVIREVLGSGINKKYAVKLKSYETDMDDVECVDVLIVRYTQLRPHFDWDGKKWVPRLIEELVDGTKLTSRKRPSSSALPLCTEVGESSAKNGSYRGKKLKSADAVSKPTSPGSICIDNSEIRHKSSSYPVETVTQGNAVVALGSQLAPPSLPSMAGFAHLTYSSLAQSSRYLEQASSQKIITLSAPLSQSRQLHASMFGTFGQPRYLTQGLLLGMQSLNPQTPKKVTSANSIEEASNAVSISADLAKQKDGVDDVELRCNVTAGREIISEINTVNCVDPTTTPKDVGGSQEGGGSAMGNRPSESLAIQHVPFVKTFPLWPQIEAMQIFSAGPQRPHLNQFRQHGPEFHEGMAFGLMLSFANLAESINMLDVEADVEGLFERKMQGLSLLEANGFDVGALRSRLESLLYRRNSRAAELHDAAMKTLEEKIARKETDDRELGVRMRVLAMALHHLGLYARLMRHMMRSTVTKKINNAMEISRLKSEANELERSSLSTAASR